MTLARIESGDTALLGWHEKRLGRKEGSGEGRYRHIFAGFCGVERGREGGGGLGARESFLLSLENADPGERERLMAQISQGRQWEAGA